MWCDKERGLCQRAENGEIEYTVLDMLKYKFSFDASICNIIGSKGFFNLFEVKEVPVQNCPISLDSGLGHRSLQSCRISTGLLVTKPYCKVEPFCALLELIIEHFIEDTFCLYSTNKYTFLAWSVCCPLTQCDDTLENHLAFKFSNSRVYTRE